jgi:hypothetical protein
MSIILIVTALNYQFGSIWVELNDVMQGKEVIQPLQPAKLFTWIYNTLPYVSQNFQALAHCHANDLTGCELLNHWLKFSKLWNAHICHRASFSQGG